VPLSDHEQRILEEIERRLQEEDPRLAQTVSSASVHAHVIRRIRLGALAFLVGFVMLLFFAVSVWVAVAGFTVMLGAALLVYHNLRRMGQDQIEEVGSGAWFSPTAFLARMAERFRAGRPDRPREE
jgi:hypothetical protein